MYAVCVQLEIVEEKMIQFMELMHKQAKNSFTKEPGCHRFDVCTDTASPNTVFLYELYANEAAFKVHLDTEHFKSFDTESSDMVISKNVKTWSKVFSGL